MLVLLFVALWFILRGDLFYVLPCVILFLCFSVLLALRIPCLGKRELILVLFVRLFDLRLFGFVCFLVILVSGKGCGYGTPWTFLLTFFKDLIEWTFIKEVSLYLACNGRNAFFASEKHIIHTLWLGQKVCEALTFLFDNTYIRLGTKLFRQNVGIPMGTNCTLLVANLFLFVMK